MLKSIAKQLVIALQTNIYETSVIVLNLGGVDNYYRQLYHTASQMLSIFKQSRVF